MVLPPVGPFWINIHGLLQTDARGFGLVEGGLIGDNFGVSAHSGSEHSPVGVGGQQPGGHGGAANDQRPPRPPDMKPVDRRQRRSGVPFPDGLNRYFVDRQPILNKAAVIGCGHYLTP